MYLSKFNPFSMSSSKPTSSMNLTRLLVPKATLLLNSNCSTARGAGRLCPGVEFHMDEAEAERQVNARKRLGQDWRWLGRDICTRIDHPIFLFYPSQLPDSPAFVFSSPPNLEALPSYSLLHLYIRDSVLVLPFPLGSTIHSCDGLNCVPQTCRLKF